MTQWWMAALVGGGVTLALWCAWRALFPAPLPLHVAHERLTRPRQLITATDEVSVKGRLGRWLGPLLEAAGTDLDAIRADARITGTSLPEHLGSKITSAVAGPLFALVLALLLLAAGIEVPVSVLVVIAVVVAAIGFFGSDLALASEAKKRREDFLVALSTYLDLVAISMEGGMGWNGAIVEAARIGDGWAFEMLRLAIDAANYDDRGVWDGFRQLGAELRVPALEDLASNLQIAGDEGARVRSSIAGRADTLRQAQLAATESAEAAVTEKLTIPSVMLLAAFVILIGFPALYVVATGV